MKQSRLRRAFVLATLLLANQSLIPILHEWRVGISETSFHGAAGANGSGPAISAESEHHHHTDADCAFCFHLSRGGAPLGATTRLHALTAPSSTVVPHSPVLTQSPALAGAPPRGPPSLV